MSLSSKFYFRSLLTVKPKDKTFISGFHKKHKKTHQNSKYPNFYNWRKVFLRVTELQRTSIAAIKKLDSTNDSNQFYFLNEILNFILVRVNPKSALEKKEL